MNLRPRRLVLVPLLLITACGEGSPNEPGRPRSAAPKVTEAPGDAPAPEAGSPQLPPASPAGHDLTTLEGSLAARKEAMEGLVETLAGIGTREEFERAKPALKALTRSSAEASAALQRIVGAGGLDPQETTEFVNRLRADMVEERKRGAVERARLERLDFWSEMDSWMQKVLREANAQL